MPSISISRSENFITSILAYRPDQRLDSQLDVIDLVCSVMTTLPMHGYSWAGLADNAITIQRFYTHSVLAFLRLRKSCWYNDTCLDGWV